MDKNYVDVQGNLVRDSEMKYTSGGMAVCNFSIACNESKKVGDNWENIPSYFDCVCFGKLAERFQPAGVKGKRFDVSGHLKQERWEKDGQTRSKIVIIADDITPASILGSSSGATGGTARATESTAPEFPDEVPW